MFCNTDAYHIEYIRPSDLAGRVQMKGRGGTRLQPGVDYLEKTLEFPANDATLTITAGEIEQDLKIKYEHAFLFLKVKDYLSDREGKFFAMI